MTFSPKVLAAFSVFRNWHDSLNHKRKYSGLPYFDHHCIPVAKLVAEVTDDEDVIIAAGAHDTIEDCFPLNPACSLDAIREGWGERVASFVFDLTDQYTRENYPNWNRKIRKAKEAARLSLIQPESATIKLSDLINNTSDIVLQDKDFARLYLREKAVILPGLAHGNAVLWKRCEAMLTEHAALWH